MTSANASAVVTEAPPVHSERRGYMDRIAKVPAEATTSGVYVVGLHRALQKAGIKSANPEAFHCLRYYPLRDYMAVMVDAAATIYPKVNLNEGLRRMGLNVIPNFARTFGGKMLMSLGECSWEMALSCVTRGYQLSLRPGRATVTILGKGRADIELNDVWNFGESYQPGVIQGLMNWYHINGSVTPEALSLSHCLLHLEWIPG